jgi:hypothetical protein
MDDDTTTNADPLVIDLTSSSDEVKVRRTRMLRQIKDFNQAPPPRGSPGSDDDDDDSDSDSDSSIDEDAYDSGDENIKDGDESNVVSNYNNSNNNNNDDDARSPDDNDDDSDDDSEDGSDDNEDEDKDIEDDLDYKVIDNQNCSNNNSDDDVALPPAVTQVTPDFEVGRNLRQRRRRRASCDDERKPRARPNHRSPPLTRHLEKRENKRRRANGGERDGRMLGRTEEADMDNDGGKDWGGGSTSANSNGYFEVDKILERRINPRRGSETTGQAVEYCECVVFSPPPLLVMFHRELNRRPLGLESTSVTILIPSFTVVQWKKPPPGTKYNEQSYEPSWTIAENLDQNSLADAFRRFPQDADREVLRSGATEEGGEENGVQSDLDIIEFSSDDEDDGEEDTEEETDSDTIGISSNGMQNYDDDYDEEDGSIHEAAMDDTDPSIAHLKESGEFSAMHPSWNTTLSIEAANCDSLRKNVSSQS